MVPIPFSYYIVRATAHVYPRAGMGYSENSLPHGRLASRPYDAVCGGLTCCADFTADVQLANQLQDQEHHSDDQKDSKEQL